MSFFSKVCPYKNGFDSYFCTFWKFEEFKSDRNQYLLSMQQALVAVTVKKLEIFLRCQNFSCQNLWKLVCKIDFFTGTNQRIRLRSLSSIDWLTLNVLGRVSTTCPTLLNAVQWSDDSIGNCIQNMLSRAKKQKYTEYFEFNKNFSQYKKIDFVIEFGKIESVLSMLCVIFRLKSHFRFSYSTSDNKRLTW